VDKLKEFFKNNDVRIGKDFDVNPPVYYSSLNDAYYNYFLTFKDKMKTFHFVLDIQSWNRESIAFNFTGANPHIVFAILGFHRFFELFVKDVLRRINPYFAVKFLEKEKELFQFFEKQIEADEIKTIEYGETIKRFKLAFEYYNKSSDIYLKYLKDYEFLNTKECLYSLELLADWRNRIMHNGTTLPNLFAFEYLVSQRLTPIIIQIIKAEKKHLGDYIPHYFETPTGIKIIEEISKVHFDYSDFSNKNKSAHLAFSLLKIGHYKEMGRVVYNFPPTLERNYTWGEDDYDNSVGRAERFAETERKHKYFFSLNQCICCGAKSLVVYKRHLEPFWSDDSTFISWFKCFNCDYSLKNNVGDPHFFDIAKEPLFASE
jgi:hypothetical protein